MAEGNAVWHYYRAHQIVQAVEITSMKPDQKGDTITETTLGTLTLPWYFVKEYAPSPGGFLVRDTQDNYSFIKREKFLDLYVLVGVKEPVDVDELRRDLEKAEEEASDWRRRYEDLKDEIRHLAE